MQRALLLALIAASYSLLAGAVDWSLWTLLGLAAALALAWPRATLRLPRAHRPLDAALLALVAAVGLQLVPLPRGLVALVSPHAEATRQALRVDALLVGPASWQPLSIDPAATWGALGALALGVLAFWIARAAFAHGGTRQFCRLLAIAGAAAALVAVAQKAAAPGDVLGMVRPPARSSNPFGAFVNRNHFAGWLLMMAAPVAGYLMAHVRMHRAYQDRAAAAAREFVLSGALITTIAAITMVGVLLLTLSRSAVAGLGGAALGGWWLARKRLDRRGPGALGLLALAGAALLAAVLFVDTEGWATRIEQSLSRAPEGLGRTVIWRETLPVVGRFWAAGTGAGTYPEAMTVYQQTRYWIPAMANWAHFNNAHSHPLQVAAEGGLLLVLPIVACLVALVRLARRALAADAGEVYWIRAGAAAGLCGIAVQSLWETPLIMPANAVACGALAGLLLHRRHTDPGNGQEARGRRARSR